MNRDELGLIRTHLANERTLLAYIRTALAFIAAGVGMIHFFQSHILHYVGWFFLVVGSVMTIFGVFHFIAEKRRITKSQR